MAPNTGDLIEGVLNLNYTNDNTVSNMAQKCDDYEECVNNNINITDGIIIPDGLYCRARLSCSINNASIVTDLNDLNDLSELHDFSQFYEYNSIYNKSNIILRCDGFNSCPDVDHVVLQLSNTSTMDTSSIYIIDVVFGGGGNNKYKDMMLQNNYKYSQSNIKINVYCNAYLSCSNHRLINVTNIYGYGRSSLAHLKVNTVYNSIYVYGHLACLYCNILNVFSNIYIVGREGCRYSNMLNVYGSIIGFSYNGLADSNISNVKQVFCLGGNTCTRSQMSSVSLIVAQHEKALNLVKIASNMVNYSNPVNALNTSTLRKMVLKVYDSSYISSFELYCSGGDSCIIECYGSTGDEVCDTAFSYCYGPGNCSVVYAAKNETNGDNSNSNSNSDSNEYNIIVVTFCVTVAMIALAIIIANTIVCGRKYVQTWLKNKNGQNKTSNTQRNCQLFTFYFCNKTFGVFLIVFFICNFLSFICLLYGFGQITRVQLSDYWCQEKSLSEIRQHSIDENLNHGTSVGCWKSKQYTVSIVCI